MVYPYNQTKESPTLKTLICVNVLRVKHISPIRPMNVATSVLVSQSAQLC